MSRTSGPSCILVASVIVIVIEIAFLIYDGVMIGLKISQKDELKETLVEKLKENDEDKVFESEEQMKKLEDIVETVIIPIIFGIYIVIFTFSLILTCMLVFGVLKKRPAVISVWICIVTVFLILNLITFLPAILFLSDFSTTIEIVNVVHQVYRIVAVIIICIYARQLRRHVTSRQSGEVFAVQYHIPPEQ